ncbi:MAG: hypothetical protein IPM53_05265 [Anaerolineaceae bacterium]|nr:hypothetical protein [Anaerolineaceae bacterium]
MSELATDKELEGARTTCQAKQLTHAKGKGEKFASLRLGVKFNDNLFVDPELERKKLLADRGS